MIIGIGGKLSGGKTVTGVKYCVDNARKQGLKVISNFKLKIPYVDCEFMSNEQFIDYLQDNYENPIELKRKFKNTILFLDEMSQLLSSRQATTNLNIFLSSFFMMVGKMSSTVIYTYQVRESHIDKQLREISDIYGNCFRMDKYMNPLIQAPRKVKEKVYIVSLWEYDFGLAGKYYSVETFDPEQYYNLYDTEEIILLDRSKYMRGGTKDLRK